ncbi:MAG TPA: 7-cyano-7-deazaguanine synthase QueC [Candidatus Omnitrophota bacterium]|nr:7-cyano-7-deazaguanine synthase QueC [Candidatus Omnitrophota bacterium]
MSKKAVVLLSGGLDSATILYYAKHSGYTPHCLIFNYGQRHRKEIEAAKRIAAQAGCDYRLVGISLPWRGSSLLDKRMRLPTRKKIDPQKIPSTYVPARNIIFLSFAVSYAEAIGARAVFIGANAIDYSGYPDCRPQFFRSFEQVVRSGMKSGVEGSPIKIIAPLVRKTKAQIVRLGKRLKVPYERTWSCYQGGKTPCGVCESCRLRQKGFEEAGSKDPILK